MSFSGPNPYGTAGGEDSYDKPTSPPDIRVARNRTVVIFLRVNEIPIERLREDIEDVVRVLGLKGNVLLGIVVSYVGTIIDDNVTDIDFIGALVATDTGISTVSIEIANLLNVEFGSGISLAKFDQVGIAEMARDAMNAALIGGNGITMTPSDVGETHTIAMIYAASGGVFGTASTVARSNHTHSGVSNVRVSTVISVPGGGGIREDVPACAAGFTPVGGGIGNTDARIDMIETFYDSPGWRTAARNNAGAALDVTFWTQCLKTTI